jgi:hypothetical protein
MFTRDQDFACELRSGIVLCVGLTPEVASTYKVLQLQIKRLLPQIPGPPKVEIIVDGIIGPSAALGLQMIVARISQGQPGVLRELGALIYAPAEQTIIGIAQHADMLTGYIDQILVRDPDAVRSPPQAIPPQPEDPIAFAKRVFTKKRLIASGVTLAGLAGLAAVASASDSRALGRVDRSGFLPESDGTDEMDDGGDDDGDDNIIDVPAEPERLALPPPE